MSKLGKIVITGAESTGKSHLAQQLAGHYNSIWIPELARGYVEQLSHPYEFSDVVNIARLQIEKEKELESHDGIVFFDTWLIITKVWFDKVYGQSPKWLIDKIFQSNIDLFLVCDIDLPWVYDPVRENGGESRIKLHEIYLREIEYFGFDYRIVSGKGGARLKNALSFIS